MADESHDDAERHQTVGAAVVSGDATGAVAQTGEEQPQPQPPPTTDGNASPEVQQDAPAAVTLCGVCETNPFKYKCPRCYLPYCSVACNKIHHENHPPDPEPKPEPKPLDMTAHLPVPTSDPKSPFRALETSDKLQTLFKKYPGLPNQLLEIHAATLPPTAGPDKVIPASLMQGIPKKDNWNHDIGIKNGKQALRKARRAGGESGEGIREYSELVLHLMNETNTKEDATAVLRDQAAQEDTKLIERLMAEESRRQ